MAEMENGVKLIRNKVSRQDLARIVGASRDGQPRHEGIWKERRHGAYAGTAFVIIKEQPHRLKQR